MRECETQVLIVGGGVGGVAAALACARMGVPCIVTEPTDWLGGQLTSQGVPPDENPWIETFGGTASYQALREAVRASAMAEGARPRAVEPFGAFNPGGGWVSRCCAEPARWHAEIRRMLQGPMHRGLVRVRLHVEPVAAEVLGDLVRAVSLRDVQTGEVELIRARFVLDATETGDLLPLAGVEHALGAEHQSVYGELHARTDFPPERRFDPADQQALSWCFALEHHAGQDHRIARPEGYERWRSYEPSMTPAWTGRLFDWLVPSHNPEGRRVFRLIPPPDEPPEGELEMWRYRRVVDGSIWPDRRPDVTIINMVQMDYWQRPILGVEPAEARAALREARLQSLCWLYWMQHEAPRHDSAGHGYPGLRLAGDVLGTGDGLAKAPYIREPRRLLARVVVHEGHLGTEQRRRAGVERVDEAWSETPHGTGERFSDTVGIGHYPIDLHPSCAGRNNIYVACAPFRIPMGALIPVRVRNLLAAGKALGVSHVANGAFRVHHVEWNVGESAGVLAAWCAEKGMEPAQVHDLPARIEEVQQVLAVQGVRLAWPWER